MDMVGERRITAPRRIVWDALNDPEVLKASIPGCQSLEKLSDTQMKAIAAVKIGPISARFAGNVQLTDLDPPNGYSIGGEGQGGVAGFAKGGAKVKLEDDGPATTLRYEVHAQVGGKIAQLGARLIDATAKQMADQFFDRFSAQVTAMAPAAETATGPVGAPVGAGVAAPVGAGMGAATAPPMEQIRAFPSAPSIEVAHQELPPAHPPAISMLSLIPTEPFGLPMAAWIGGAAYVVILLLFFGSLL
ncbi:MAG TPA: carbon monoxide dehydrogenase subunit G [Caulobacteraceae bacterium]|nr:carbon monoxide dehydrogenase subunit G [Caulobacteraceae bacterium]